MGLQIPITESPSLKSSARRPGLDKADIAVRHYSLNFEMAVDRHQDARGKQSGGSLMTHRWREPDSNHRSRERRPASSWCRVSVAPTFPFAGDQAEAT